MCEVAVSAMREDELLEFIRTRKTFKECEKALDRLSKLNYKIYNEDWIKELENNFKQNKPIII